MLTSPAIDRRLFAAVIALTLALGGVLVATGPAHAVDPACGVVVGGKHQVSTVAHLKAVGSGGVGTGDCGLGASYEQTGAIDISQETSWTPIGSSSSAFSGTYDGGGHVIRAGSTWDGTTYTGLFGYVGSTGTLTHVALENVIVTDSTAFAAGRGLLVGINQGTIEKSYATGSITTPATTGGNQKVGGLVGINNGGTIDQSFAAVDISGGAFLGGLVGENTNSGIIRDSYATGDVTGYQDVAGLIGWNETSPGVVERTFATGRVTDQRSRSGAISMADASNPVQDSYYDLTLSGVGDQQGGQSRTSEQMRSISNYQADGWPIVSGTSADGTSTQLWGIDPATNSGFPHLWWQQKNAFCPRYSSGVYQVTTPPELAAVASGGAGTLSTGVDCGAGDSYALQNAINLTNFGPWAPISPDSNPFTGTFNGGRYVIKAGTSWGDEFVGLFGRIGSGGLVQKVSLENVNASDTVRLSGDPGKGALAQRNDGTIEESYARGSITSRTDSGTGTSFIGGLVGKNVGVIEHSFAAVDIEGASYLGGLAGTHAGGVVRDSYATGNVTGFSYLGGVVGLHSGGSSGVLRTYATGRVVEGGSGFAGAMASGFDSVQASYFDPTLSGRGDSNGGISRNSAQLRSVSNWATWEIVASSMPSGGSGEVWGIDPSINSGYPFLWWQQVNAFCPRDVSSNVYQVRTAPELAAVGSGGSGSINSGAICGRDDDYELTSAVDLTNFGPWYPIGPSSTAAFWGSLDGNSHAITKLTINQPTLDLQGLVGYAEANASITDVRLESVSVSGRHFTGALVGLNKGTVTSSSSSGTVEGSNYVGGLVGGMASGTSAIGQSYSSAAVTGRGSTSPDFESVGGLVGDLRDGSVTDSWASGPVDGDNLVGGLIGVAKDATVSNSFSIGEVTADTVGGAGGLVGGVLSTNTFTSSYYDATVTGLSDTGKGAPRTTEQLGTLSTFTGWAMVQSNAPTGPTTQTWGISSTKNSCYPFLWWQAGLVSSQCDAAPSPTVTTSQHDDNTRSDRRAPTVAPAVPGISSRTLGTVTPDDTASDTEQPAETSGSLEEPDRDEPDVSDGELSGEADQLLPAENAGNNSLWTIALIAIGLLLILIATVSWFTLRRPGVSNR